MKYVKNRSIATVSKAPNDSYTIPDQTKNYSGDCGLAGMPAKCKSQEFCQTGKWHSMAEGELTTEVVCNESPYALDDEALDSLLICQSRPEVL